MSTVCRSLRVSKFRAQCAHMFNVCLLRLEAMAEQTAQQLVQVSVPNTSEHSFPYYPSSFWGPRSVNLELARFTFSSRTQSRVHHWHQRRQNGRKRVRDRKCRRASKSLDHLIKRIFHAGASRHHLRGPVRADSSPVQW
jgi:hypothetical protein